jgi:intracellular sulfur oxidation DsrE/DsrF family protein
MNSFLAALMAATAVVAQPASAPLAVPHFGAPAAVADAHERPDPARDYKVVFDLAAAPASPARTQGGLERAARLVNMLAQAGVSPERRHIVVVLHGGATETVLNDEAYGRRHEGARNTDAPLIAELQNAGVQVHVCGQALAGAHIAPADLLPGVQTDLAALITVTHLQLDGYALVEG